MARLKTLPVSHLEKLVRENKPVYIVNTSSLPSGDKGTIIINFFDGNRREFFKMPPTFIPMAITDSIPPRQLVESKDFRQSLLKGMLTLVEPASAEAFLSTTEAQDEYESLVLSEHSASAQHININKAVSQRTKTAHVRGDGGAGPLQDVAAVDTVSNKVRGLIESMLAQTLSTKEVLTQLRRHQSALNPVDFSYVVANTTDSELRKWAKGALKRSSEEDEVEDEYEVEAEVDEAPRKQPKAKIAAKKKSEVVRNNDYKEVFDFGGKDDDMTPSERALDDQARAQAMGQQSVYGESKIEDEINRIMSGKL